MLFRSTAAVRGSWWTAVQAIIALPVSFVANVVVARSLGPDAYGRLGSYMIFFSIAVIVLNAGISDATIQWGAGAHARGDRAELLAIGRRCAGFHLLVETPLLTVAVFAFLHDETLLTRTVAALAAGLTMAVGTGVVVLTAIDRKSTRLNSSHSGESRMPSSA